MTLSTFSKKYLFQKNPLSQGKVAEHGHMPGDAGMPFEKIRKLNGNM
jgi:hypothetical protein